MIPARTPDEEDPESTALTIPIPYRIIALMRERERLFAYPQDLLADGIRATGFRCTCCGACCTRAVSRHVFLLDREVERAKNIDPAAIEPAPDPEFCDQYGVMYVSGYALRTKNDIRGSCWFLKDGRCRIYEQRFSGCRIYPHMLRRSTDAAGRIVWKKFSRKNMHGTHGPALFSDDSHIIAGEVREYENAYLTQQISFLKTIQEYFSMHDLRHDPEMHRNGALLFSQGLPVKLKVFHAGELEDP